MACTLVPTPGGGVAIVCHRGKRTQKCCACSRPSAFQCDWKTGKDSTCDAHICGEHATQVATGKHLCPIHQKAFEQWKERRQSSRSST